MMVLLWGWVAAVIEENIAEHSASWSSLSVINIMIYGIRFLEEAISQPNYRAIGPGNT